MDMNVIIQAITSVGFPIVMCLMLMWYVREISSKHKEESDKFAEALNSNTLVLQKLCDKLDITKEDK
ncbi:MAG: hypothetical protein J6S67_01950 [Methanobrevibacter sp.]|nr:hypothetical protein [Methanobrevibacter sp.]